MYILISEMFSLEMDPIHPKWIRNGVWIEDFDFKSRILLVRLDLGSRHMLASRDCEITHTHKISYGIFMDAQVSS